MNETREAHRAAVQLSLDTRQLPLQGRKVPPGLGMPSFSRLRDNPIRLKLLPADIRAIVALLEAQANSNDGLTPWEARALWTLTDALEAADERIHT